MKNEKDDELTTGEMVSGALVLGGVLAMVKYHKVFMPLLAALAVPAALCGAAYLAGSHSGRNAENKNN